MDDQYVVDTSVIARIFTDNKDRNRVLRFISLAEEQGVALHMPVIFWYEIASALLGSEIPDKEARAHLKTVEMMAESALIVVHPHMPGVYQAALLAASTVKKGFGYVSVFDATFHALALELGCDFLTADKKHYHKTKDSIGHVVLLEKVVP